MVKTTPATFFLDSEKISYELVSYDYDPSAERIGVHAAQSIGVPANQVFKTLMFEVDGKPHVALLPSDRQANMKKLAAFFQGKHAKLLAVAEAERITGYKVGGISPFGQRKRVPCVFEKSALDHSAIYLNGGGRGLQVRLKPNDAIESLGARVADFVRDIDT